MKTKNQSILLGANKHITKRTQPRLPSLKKQAGNYRDPIYTGNRNFMTSPDRIPPPPVPIQGFGGPQGPTTAEQFLSQGGKIDPVMSPGFDPNMSSNFYANVAGYGNVQDFGNPYDARQFLTDRVDISNMVGDLRRIYTPALPENNNSVYGVFASSDVIENQQETVTKGLWSGYAPTLLQYFTSSAQTAVQKQYYYEIFNSASSGVTAEPQFSIAYGNRNGSGSLIVGGGGNNDTVSRAIYSQYKLLLLEPGDSKFTINGVDTDQIYIINVNRARFRESLDPGNIQINLAQLNGTAYANANYTGSNVQVSSSGKYINLIDDSSVNSAPTVGAAGRRYNIVSGSMDAGIHNPSSPHYYGMIYPQLGMIILNANTLNASASFNTVTGSNKNGDNAYKLFTSISGAAQLTDNYGELMGFEARSSELVKSAHYFVRVKNAEYNFSNNPSFVTGSDGDFAIPTFANDPQVYITTVGLYNSSGEMLAVAKLSKPLLKSFTREALVKVKLQF